MSYKYKSINEHAESKESVKSSHINAKRKHADFCFLQVHLLCLDAAVYLRKIRVWIKDVAGVLFIWTDSSRKLFHLSQLPSWRVTGFGHHGAMPAGKHRQRRDTLQWPWPSLTSVPRVDASCLATQAIAICSGSFSLKLRLCLNVVASPIFKLGFEVIHRLNASTHACATFELKLDSKLTIKRMIIHKSLWTI